MFRPATHTQARDALLSQMFLEVILYKMGPSISNRLAPSASRGSHTTPLQGTHVHANSRMHSPSLLSVTLVAIRPVSLVLVGVIIPFLMSHRSLRDDGAD